MLIFRQKSFYFCTPLLKTQQPVLPYWLGFFSHCLGSFTKLSAVCMYFLLQGNPSMGSMESMGCAEAKKQLFVKTAMFKVCTVHSSLVDYLAQVI